MNSMRNRTGWKFIDDNGTFLWKEPEAINELYFPLCNEAGFMASITPKLHGDSKTSQNDFLLIPVSIEDIHNTRSARNFWIYINDKGAWSATGNSTLQNSRLFVSQTIEERVIEAGLLWHKLFYRDKDFGLSSTIINFVPVNTDTVEVMSISIKNESNQNITITPTSAIPIFGRSAENLRDHRHVTSLINRVINYKNGIGLKPVIRFNEHNHQINNNIFYVLGYEDNGSLPAGVIPVTGDFIGCGGNFENPEAVIRNLSPDLFRENNTEGKEIIGAIRFQTIDLSPGELKKYIILMGITDNNDKISSIQNRYCSIDKIEDLLKKNQLYWQEKSASMEFESGITDFSSWMKWVGIQPVLRKIYGCSFLPHHDYGKGGRGWRDLWQDSLSLVLQNTEELKDKLSENFSGIRIDGTNATIIGHNPGEFKADRNNIPRVWMDHGCWPYLTARLYIDQTGDLDFLLQEKQYFSDALFKRASVLNKHWNETEGTMCKTKSGEIYKGNIIEHLLVQNLISFFNVGEHNIIRLEDADWNDAIDMAYQKGESTAFSAFYAGNLCGISNLLSKLKDVKKLHEIEIFEEMAVLIDSISCNPDYNDIQYKKNILSDYFNRIDKGISGKKKRYKLDLLSEDLKKKGEWLKNHIRKNEWLNIENNSGFFNSYYNNDGEAVDGIHNNSVIMNLAGQVFTVMFGIADDNQVHCLYKACLKYLIDPETNGLRINTPLGDNRMNFGRVFAFAYGEKENGAIFNHLIIMFINALYKRNFVNEAYELFSSVYKLCMDSANAKIYPGIPEYFTSGGKGMYHYLTGSASWILITALQEIYGIKGNFGSLVLEPKLVKEQFDKNCMASVTSTFSNKKIKVSYTNKDHLEYGFYKIIKASLNRIDISKLAADGKKITIPRQDFLLLIMDTGLNEILIELGV